MRFLTAIAAFGLVAFTSAQATSSNVTSIESVSSTSANAPASASLTAEQQCIQSCGASDICCKAACVHVPCPSDLQANQTTECAGQCTQGNGSAEDTQSYAACQSRCISSLFFSTSGAAAATAGGSSGSNTATTTAGGIGGDSQSASQTGTASASAASSTSTDNAGVNVRTSLAGAGLIGLFIAGLAL